MESKELKMTEKLVLGSIGIISSLVSCFIHLVMWGFMLESRQPESVIVTLIFTKGYIHFAIALSIYCVWRMITGKRLLKFDLILLTPPILALLVFLKLSGYLR